MENEWAKIKTMTNDFLLRFGERVKNIRIAQGLSQEKLAEKALLHRTYVGMIERGEKNITLKNIYRIAHGLGVDIRDLF